MSTVVKNVAGTLLITKGAPESVLSKCEQVEGARGIQPIESVRQIVDTKLAEESGAGYRTIAVAYRNVEPKPSYSVDDEARLTFLGFVTFTDPPKQDARQALDKLKAMGVDVKILTGDNELVAVKICEELGVPVYRRSSRIRINAHDLYRNQNHRGGSDYFRTHNPRTEARHHKGSEDE